MQIPLSERERGREGDMMKLHTIVLGKGKRATQQR